MNSRRTFLKQTSVAGIALAIANVDNLFASESDKGFL